MATAFLDRLQTFGASIRGSATILASDQAGQTFEATPARYELAEKYYANTIYERYDARESAIKQWYGLPRQIRPVLSLVKPAVDWWPHTLFGGVWTSDGLPSSDGEPNLLPFDADTPEEVRLAIQTAFGWGNGEAEIPAWCLSTSKLGDGFGEIEIDYDREKAYPVFHHPKYVTNIEWNRSGDVIEYTIEIPRRDSPTEQPYLWGKTVTKETVTTLRNGKPFSYTEGQPPEMDNAFGFVYAVWIQHVNVGGQHGAGVVDGLYPVLDEVAGVLGASLDFIHKFVKQHVLIETTDTAGAKRTTDAEVKRGSTADLANPRADRETQVARFVPPGTAVHRLIENIGLGEAHPFVVMLLENIEKNVPELTIDEKIATQRQASYPGAWATAQPMQRRVNGTFGNYITGLRKLGQMAVSINGEMLRSGGWGRDSRLRTAAQDLFRPFDVGSYGRGDLPVSFTRPKLISPLMGERAADAAAIERLTSRWALEHVGLGDGDLFGVDADGKPNEAPPDVGLIAEREGRRQQEADSIGGLFNGGGTF